MDNVSVSVSEFKRARNYMLGEKKRGVVRGDAVCADWKCAYCGERFVKGDIYANFEVVASPSVKYHYRCISELYKRGLASYALAFLSSHKLPARIGKRKNVKCFLSSAPIHEGDMVYEHRWYLAKAEDVEKFAVDLLRPKSDSYISDVDREWMAIRMEINENYKSHEHTNDPHPYSHVPNDLHAREETLLDVIGGDHVYTLLKRFPELL